MKNFIKESLRTNLIETILDEDYPLTFDMNKFKMLNNFAKRIKYCEEHLTRISSGSARIVYKIDDQKVLKLAKNKKGLAQNEVEISHSKYTDLGDVLAHVFDYNQDNLWTEMELARKVTPTIFKNVTGFLFKDYVAAVHNYGNDVNYTKYHTNYPIDKEILNQMWEDEFVSDMFHYIANYSVPVGDLERINSYGLVKRNGKDAIVLIDFGLDNDTYETYY